MSSLSNVVLFPSDLNWDDDDREADVRRRVDDERRQIARELHDVASYSFATIGLQAGVAARVLEDKPQQVAAALDAIRAASEHALREFRTILDGLREVTTHDSSAPGLSQLDSLIADVESAGLPTRLVVRGQQRPLPIEVDRAAYRIIQQSLANVLRHAGCATASVVVSYDDEWLVVVIDDDGCGRKPGSGDLGSGIHGMRERALELGGELVAGPQPARGFRVSARLPTSIRR